jgi:hypothetical protein
MGVDGMSPESRRFARIVGFGLAGTFLLAALVVGSISAISAVLFLLTGLAIVLALIPRLLPMRTRQALGALAVLLTIGAIVAAPRSQQGGAAQPTPTVVGAAKPAATLTAISAPQASMPATSTPQVPTLAPTPTTGPPTPPPPTEVGRAESTAISPTEVPTAEPTLPPPASTPIPAKPATPVVAAKPPGGAGIGSGSSEQRPASAPTPKPSALGVLPASRTACPVSHPIKGNQGSRSNVDWIYHVPGSNSYNATQPERCFATEEEARTAGYRAPLR